MSEVSRQPLHPAIVHLPIGCWVLVPILDFVGQTWPISIPGLDLHAAAHGLLLAGLAFSIPAILAGMIDLVRAPPRIRNSPLIVRHMSWMGAAWCTWLFAALLRSDLSAFDEPPGPLILMIEIAATALLSIGGHIAGRVVYPVGDAPELPETGLAK